MLLKSRASLICFRARFLPGLAKDLSAPRQQSDTISLAVRFYGDLMSPATIKLHVICPSFLHDFIKPQAETKKKNSSYLLSAARHALMSTPELKLQLLLALHTTHRYFASSESHLAILNTTLAHESN